jgi:small-conductance mechanosensitive channel
MAQYEATYGKEDLSISNYYRKDYLSLHTLRTCIWVSLGYLLLSCAVAVCTMDRLLQDFTTGKIVIIVALFLVGYLVVLIGYGIGTSRHYRRRYMQAKRRTKIFYRELSRLEKMLKKEKEVE